MPYILEELEVYLLSEKLAAEIWQIVMVWPTFEKFGVGKQLTSSVDSISANIAEGYGRYFVKENIHFCFYARGSLLETKSWIRKSYQRGLINEITHGLLMDELELIHRKLNGYIKVLKNNTRP
ncbi:MAG: four helix bundle protein [Bacteroidetes bacterium]|nr:four helix bundle protein [Bacteroidota bacterium]